MIVLAPAPSYSPADLASSADRATTASNSEFGDGTAARFDGQSADGSTGKLSLNKATPPSLNIAAQLASIGPAQMARHVPAAVAAIQVEDINVHIGAPERSAAAPASARAIPLPMSLGPRAAALTTGVRARALVCAVM
jgi:hypothetical protein